MSILVNRTLEFSTFFHRENENYIAVILKKYKNI